MPSYRPLFVWKGNTFNRTFAFKQADRTPANISEKTFVFLVTWPATTSTPAGSIRRATDDGSMTMDTVAGTVSLALTVAETRTIPTGSIAKYELEVLDTANQVTVLYGEVKASEWVDDV